MSMRDSWPRSHPHVLNVDHRNDAKFAGDQSKEVTGLRSIMTSSEHTLKHMPYIAVDGHEEPNQLQSTESLRTLCD